MMDRQDVQYRALINGYDLVCTITNKVKKHTSIRSSHSGEKEIVTLSLGILDNDHLFHQRSIDEIKMMKPSHLFKNYLKKKKYYSFMNDSYDIRCIHAKEIDDYLKSVLFESLEESAEDLSLNGLRYSTLLRCDGAEADRILEMTDFVQDDGEAQSSSIRQEEIMRAGLEPAFEIMGESRECYLSKVFQAYPLPDKDPVEYQLAAVAYVANDHNRYLIRMVYLSNIDNLWRVMLINDDRTLEKRMAHSMTNIPFRVAINLYRMISQPTTSTFIQYREENSSLLRSIFFMIPANKCDHERMRDDFLKHHQLKKVDFIKKMRKENNPDFTFVNKYLLPGIFSTQITAYQLFSRDQKYEYLFYEAASHGKRGQWREKKPHVWLASVDKVDSLLTTYLTHQETIDPQGADLSGSTYIEKLRKIHLHKEQRQAIAAKMNISYEKIPSGTIVPTLHVRYPFKIIQQFEEWRHLRPAA